MIKKIIDRIFKKSCKTISFQQGFDLTSLPVVTLRQGDKKLNFLLDTGSSDCIIDSNILEYIEHDKLEGGSNLWGLEGHKQEASRCRIVVSYKGDLYDHNYLVSDMTNPFKAFKDMSGVTLHGILGSDFFNKFKYVLDFEELIAYSKA